MSVADAEIGKRVAIIRARRGMSQSTAAGFAGISKSYLSLLENGHRRFESRGLIDRVAYAIGCAPADILTGPHLASDPATADVAAGIPAISRAMFDSDLDDPPDIAARPVGQLVKAASDANLALDDAQFALAARGLGDLLTELQVQAAIGDTDTRRAALAALGEACMVATAVARHIGRPELAIQAARRGTEAAKELGDTALAGQFAVQRALGLQWIGAHRRLRDVLHRGLLDLGEVDPSAEDTTAAQAAILLHLTYAWQDAQAGDAASSDTHLAEARSLAAHTGERNWLKMHAGPASVELWGLECAAELGRPEEVEKVASVDALSDALGSPNRRCVLHFNLARLYALGGNDRDTLTAAQQLDSADRIAPQGIRSVPVARELLEELRGRARRKVWELDSLAARFSM